MEVQEKRGRRSRDGEIMDMEHLVAGQSCTYRPQQRAKNSCYGFFFQVA